MNAQDKFVTQEVLGNTDVSFCVPEGSSVRADLFLSELLGISRSRVQKNIMNENLSVNGIVVSKNSFRKFPERALVEFEIEPIDEISAEPEEMELKIVFENSDFLIIDKPAGLVVHPGAGNKSGTLINGVLFHLAGGPGFVKKGDPLRPGLVHRIDKDTSGLLVVAKNTKAFEELSSKFAVHDIEREYRCVVFGKMPEEKGRIETFHGRDPHNRLKFSPDVKNGRKAVTNYTVEAGYKYCSVLNVKLETGRTHQIRMHMSHAGHPIVNDALYGGVRKTPDAVLNGLFNISGRQLLHAGRLGFKLFGKDYSFSSDVPDDMKKVIDHLESISGGEK
ncbi:MAG TPA: RluA family pseudouridine synthase [bacterium]|nr:RluA family pseudouridine synthase [bacterium]